MELNAIRKRFEEIFGEGGNIRFFTSPGRVNMIGEHTDYNGGVVFPAALTMRTVIAFRERNDDIIKMAATDLDVLVEADIGKLADYKDIKWNFEDNPVDIVLINLGTNDDSYLKFDYEKIKQFLEEFLHYKKQIDIL